jgi:hypothetical protein
MNNKKLALAVIAVLLVAGLIGAGIMAWFTSEQAIVGNLFEAGTLVIELDEETPAEALMKFENMQPGDVEEATATIKNAGTLPFKFYAIITEDSHVPGNDGAGSEGGYLPDMLVVTVTMQGGKVYEAPLSALLNQVLVYADDDGDPVTVDPDETADINIKVVFNTAAGNEYQNAAFTGTITFIATQVDNPTEWQIFTFEKEKETAVEFSTQGVEMKVKAGDDTNTVITVERYDTSTNPPPSDMDPAGIYLDINADPPLPEGSEVVLEVSYAHLLPLPGGFPESALKLFHFNDTTGEWEDVTETVDTVNKKIISEPISSFSVFGIFYDVVVTVVEPDKANNVTGSTDESYMGYGSWKNKGPSFKTTYNIYPTNAFGHSIKLNDIASLSYVTKKNAPQGAPDFYVNIYCTPITYRLSGEPLYSRGLNAPANQWNTWSTEAGTNQLTFYDSNRQGVPPGFYYGPTLAQLQAGPINWKDYYAGASSTNIDYGNMTINRFAFETSAGWSNFNGYIDAIVIKLKNGKTYIFDLEP